MKTIMIFGLIAITHLSVFSQPAYYNSDNYVAFCNEMVDSEATSTHVYLRNDSIIIRDRIYNQCCPGFEFKISEIDNDTLFVSFVDTATMVCDCMCDYDITLNAGEFLNERLTLIYNGEIFKLNSYDSIMVGSKIWSNLSGGYGVEMIECCYSTTYFKIETDPLINTIEEKQILASTDSMQTWTKIGNIKESGKRIYFRDLENNQGLLYDFGAEKGDIINIVNYAQNNDFDTITVCVTNIDTIEYFGIQRQGFEVQDTLDGQKDYWITGIGSMKGLLNPCFEIAGGFRELLCVFDDNMQIYQNTDRMTCYMDDTCIKPIADFNYSILESLPVQIDLESTAQNADSIIWQAKNIEGNDTIIGFSKNFRIKDITKFKKLVYQCLIPPCPELINISMIVINNCGADTITKGVTIDYSNSIELNSFDKIKLFPNPSNGKINIEINIQIDDLNFNIYNSIGQLIKYGQLHKQNSEIFLEPGFYIINIFNGNNLIFKNKLLIENSNSQ